MRRRSMIVSDSKIKKLLGRKNYGSIGHLPTSRLGPGDHHVHDGQAAICLSKARDRHDAIFVTEKLDGSNVGVARIDGVLHPLGRAGWPARSSPFEQHVLFHVWVMANQDRFLAVLDDGERIVGEWLAQAHGTRYVLPHEPFVVFDVMAGEERRPWATVVERARAGGFVMPRLLHAGYPISLERVLGLLEPSGHGAVDSVEGAVWRVEHRGAFDFMAKFVRPDKEDGTYLPERSSLPAVWNWRPDW